MPHDHTCQDTACGCGHDHGAHGHGPRPPVSPPPRPWRPADHLRCIVIGVFDRAGQILCAPVHDDAGRIIGWCPLGGALGFGERAAECLSRVMQDQTGQEITDIRPLGIVENLFTHEGAEGHEIVLVLSARFITPQIYDSDALAFSDDGRTDEAKWIPLAKVRAGRLQLFPAGLIDLLPQ